MNLAVITLVCSTLLVSERALAQFSQQGPKLVGSGATGGVPAGQGTSVFLSADGNTAIVGGSEDGNIVGAAWVWTRSGGVWTQQGPKLVASDDVGNAQQGYAVSLSADGNTAIVGGNLDAGDGAVWIWTRSAGIWTQQGPKLVASDGVPTTNQGSAVALSADGNTAIVGGPADNSARGAAWIWTQSGGVWTQQGPKLVGSGAGGALQGISVSLSGDGNTAIIGGSIDSGGFGAAWVWTRSGGVWSEQAKLVGSGAAGIPRQGTGVALSGDGNTAIVGGPGDAGIGGAAWIWTRSGGIWTQQGAKLVGSGASGAQQGYSVSISADGNTAVVGGPTGLGGAWIWTRSAGVWTQQGARIVGSGAIGSVNQGESVAISGDGTTVILGGPFDNNFAGAAWVFAAAGTAGTGVPTVAEWVLLALAGMLAVLGIVRVRA